MDTNQVIIISATTIMTLLLTIIGVQLIFILKDVRSLLSKINRITQELEKVGIGVSNGYGEIVSFVSGIGKLFQIVDVISKKGKKKSS